MSKKKLWLCFFIIAFTIGMGISYVTQALTVHYGVVNKGFWELTTGDSFLQLVAAEWNWTGPLEFTLETTWNNTGSYPTPSESYIIAILFNETDELFRETYDIGVINPGVQRDHDWSWNVTAQSDAEQIKVMQFIISEGFMEVP